MMNKGKRIACFALAAAIVASSCLSAAAATENWNDASANTSVSDEWEAWKTEWQTVQNDYEKIALTVGKTESEQLVFPYAGQRSGGQAFVGTEYDRCN